MADDDLTIRPAAARHLTRDNTTALRLLAATAAKSGRDVLAIHDEIQRDGKGGEVMLALCHITDKLLDVLDDAGALEGGKLQFLENAAHGQTDVIAQDGGAMPPPGPAD